MSRVAEHLARGSARDPRARPQPRIHPERPVHDAHRGRLVRRAGAPLRRATDATKVGVVEPAPPALEATITAVADAVRPEGRRHGLPRPRVGAMPRSRAGSSKPSIDVPADLSGAGPGPVQEGARPGPRRASSASAVVGLRAQARSTRVDVDQAGRGRRSRPRRSTLDPQTEADQARFLFANIGAVLILVGIFSFGFTVLTGRRRGEAEPRRRGRPLDRPAARPADGQGPRDRGPRARSSSRVFVLAAAIAALVTDRFVLPDDDARRPSPCSPSGSSSATPLYSTALGFLGALASRMEEASNASTPVTMVAMLSYFVAIFAVLDDPDGTVATVATFIPPIGALRRPVAFGVRRDPPVAARRLDRPDAGIHLCPVHDRGPGIRRRGTADRGPDQAPRRVAVRREVAGSVLTPAAVGQGSSGSRTPGVPPACQKTTASPSSAPPRNRSTSPARALAV